MEILHWAVQAFAAVYVLWWASESWNQMTKHRDFSDLTPGRGYNEPKGGVYPGKPPSTQSPPPPTATYGTGRFSRFTYGTGVPKVTNVVGASPTSMDWCGPFLAIQSEDEYREALRHIEQFWDAPKDSPGGHELERLCEALEEYECAHFPIEAPSPEEARRFREEQEGTTFR